MLANPEFINENSVLKLKKKFNLNYDKNLWKNKKKLANIINEYDAIIVRNKTQLNKKILNKNKKLKFIGRLGVGLDNIDTKHCKNVGTMFCIEPERKTKYILKESFSAEFLVMKD